MARQTIGATRLAQRTAGAAANANFTELYARTEKVSVEGATEAGEFDVPAGYAIAAIYISENASAAVTGGLKFGTTAGGTDVVAAQAVAADALLEVDNDNILKTVFSKTADQTIYFDAVTGWNAAEVDIHVYMREVW